ncbi:MAG: carboxypeptidase-like regulatory domain-containing protein, partial [Muribaculaceae bacterium]
MKHKLFPLMLLGAALPSVAQTAAVSGTVVDASTGAPVPGATISIQDQGITVTTGPAGDFRISTARPGEAVLTITAPGYAGGAAQLHLYNDQSVNAGNVILISDDDNEFVTFNEDNNNELLFDESMLEDEEGNGQAVTALTGASDNIYYKFTRYGYSPLYSNYRGVGSRYQETYINSLPMNDLIRGGFSFSQLGGMTSRAFRNNTSTVGLGAAAYGFGGISGSQNFNTITDTYAPGFNGSLSYTNSNYNYRAMATYSSGLTPNGFAVTLSAIGRYSKEGVVPGTFYNSGGLFLSVEKVFDNKNSLTLTAWGAPTQYANGKATVQEVYDLVGDNLYNPTWGWQAGKKRSDNIREKFDPTAMLTWLHKGEKTTLNTSVAFRWTNFARTRLNYYKANDPKPDYYKNLPSYFIYGQDTPEWGLYDYYTNLWENNIGGIQQIDWDAMYLANHLNNIQNQSLPEDQQKGSTYIQQMEHSKQFNFIAGTTLNHRFSDNITFQAGVNFNYTRSAEYMTVRDLLGGQFWVDVDPFSDRDMYDPTANPDILQNDLDNPNRKVVKGDRFGYDYNIHAMKLQAWVQNQHKYAHWDINYGASFSWEEFYRFGHMRNGRAPLNSLGKSKTLDFEDFAVKAGVTYKLDGRNFFTVQAQYSTDAPLIS